MTFAYKIPAHKILGHKIFAHKIPGQTVGYGALFAAIAIICVACASRGDQQAPQDIAPNVEILKRIEAQFAAARKAYPSLSATRAEQPESLTRDEVEAAARALDELGAMLRALVALDVAAGTSRQSLRYVYEGESLTLEEAALRLGADLEVVRSEARALQNAPAPALGGPAPRIGDREAGVPPPAPAVPASPLPAPQLPAPQLPASPVIDSQPDDLR